MNSQRPAHAVQFYLSLTSERYMAYYKGKASSIQTRSIDNKTIRFPANAIREFLTHDGIHGLFEIQFDKNNKLIKIEKID
jgi:adenine deaminase